MIRQYIGFLSAKGQTGAIRNVAPYLVRSGDPRLDRERLLGTINGLLAVDDPAAASGLWRLLIAQGWVVADTIVPNNAGFLREPLPVSFDWSLPEYEGLHSWPGSSGLETEFAGNQPEDCTIAEQVVVLKPGNYALSYGYRTSDIPPSTGIKWQILEAIRALPWRNLPIFPATR